LTEKEKIKDLKTRFAQGQIKIDELLSIVESLKIEDKEKEKLRKIFEKIAKEQSKIFDQIIFDFEQEKEKKVKCSMHLEKQKQGSSDKTFKSLLIELKKDDLIPADLALVPANLGLNLTWRQQSALFAVQKMLSETKYTPTILGEQVYIFKKSDFLKAYGCKPIQTMRGKMEFSGRDRQDAMTALKELAQIKCWVCYNLAPNKKGKRDRIVFYEPILSIGFQILSSIERSKLEAQTKLCLKPNRVFFDDIDRYYLLKPDNYLELIKSSSSSKYTLQFCDWVFAQIEYKRRAKEPSEVKISTLILAQNLRLNELIESQQMNKIKDIIKDGAAVAIKHSWITKHIYDAIEDMHKFFWDIEN